jgi:hypothetical protein
VPPFFICYYGNGYSEGNYEPLGKTGGEASPGRRLEDAAYCTRHATTPCIGSCVFSFFPVPLIYPAQLPIILEGTGMKPNSSYLAYGHRSRYSLRC